MVGRCGIVALGAALAAAAVPGRARADEPGPRPPVDPIVEGQELARQGEWSRAIERFKAADQLQPRAVTACLIGLAYTRRDLLTQAEVFLARCRERATATDPAPDWLPEAEQTLAAKLAGATVAEVAITVEPPEATAGARVHVTGFLPDETFAPGTIHLPPGSYVVTVTADGFETARQPIEIDDRAPRTVAIPLRRPGDVVVEPPRPPPEPRPARRSPAKWLLIGAGAAAAVGVGFHVLAYRERGELADARDANDLDAYDDHEATFDTYRAITFACYGAALAAGAIGAYLHFSRDDAAGPELSAGLAPGGDGAMITIGWTR